MSIYKILIDQRFVNFDYDKLFSIVKEYGLVRDIPVDEEKDPVSEPQLYAFEYEDCKDIYFGNLYFHHVSNDHEVSLQIYIKHPDEPWYTYYDGVRYWPRNDVFRIYRKYRKKIFEMDWFQNEAYDSGNWDAYIFHTIKALSNFVNDLTEYSKFQKVYKK
jgi:hypothetical protein